MTLLSFLKMPMGGTWEQGIIKQIQWFGLPDYWIVTIKMEYYRWCCTCMIQYFHCKGVQNNQSVSFCFEIDTSSPQASCSLIWVQRQFACFVMARTVEHSSPRRILNGDVMVFDLLCHPRMFLPRLMSDVELKNTHLFWVFESMYCSLSRINKRSTSEYLHKHTIPWIPNLHQMHPQHDRFLLPDLRFLFHQTNSKTRQISCLEICRRTITT